jgi:carboxyl-terminal processing protease
VKKRALILATALLASACSLIVDGSDSTPRTTEAPTTTTTLASTTTVFAGLPVELTDCSSPPEGFDVLCDAYRLLDENFVDPIDDEALAAGAARGMEQYEPETTEPTPPGHVTCALPTDAFAEACEVFAEVRAAAAVPAADLVEAAVRGMIHYGLDDPHTVYLSPDALAQVTEDQSGEVSGIGALVRGEDQTSEERPSCSVLSDTCLMVIIATLDGSPAQAEGILAGDGIVKVNGENVDGWTVDEVVAVVRGPAGTDVTLGLLRNGQIIELTITRAAVVVPVVVAELREPGIGYVALSSFTNNSADQVHDALESLLAEGADRIIFDVRNNPGGSLTASVRIASEFLADGLVLRTQSPEETREYSVEPGGAATDPDLAIVVLVNRGSASASELVSAVLQERSRATVIGEPTFGKNTVQQRFDVSNGGALSLTIARWVTPDGRDTGVFGVQPDLEPEIPDGTDTDVVLQSALEFLRGQR